MSISKEYAKLIIERKTYQGDIDYDHNPIIKAMIELFTKDVKQTIQFLETECTGEQIIWISEILDEIIEITKSQEILDAYCVAVEKYPELGKKYNIKYFIESAADYLD